MAAFRSTPWGATHFSRPCIPVEASMASQMPPEAHAQRANDHQTPDYIAAGRRNQTASRDGSLLSHLL